MKHLALALAFSCLCISSPALAGGGHEHNHEAAVEAAPHGGILRDSPPYKTELVLNQDQAKLYLYDKNLAPVASDRLAPTAKGELGFPRDKTKRQVVLTLKEGVYQGVLSGISSVHRYDLHILITVDGKEIVGDFGVDNIH